MRTLCPPILLFPPARFPPSRLLAILWALIMLSTVACQSSPEPERSPDDEPSEEAAQPEETARDELAPGAPQNRQEEAETESDESGGEPGESEPGIPEDQSGNPEDQGEESLESLGDVVVDGEFIEVDGLEMRDVSCEFGSGADMFALVEVVATVADAKATLDSCAPDGAAARISFAWPGNTSPDVLEITEESARDCVADAFAELQGPMKAQCTAVVAFGDKKGASAAADTLFPLQE